MRFLSWLITLPILLVLLSFALANRTGVTLSFWPLGTELELPLSALALGMLFAGMLMGAFITWLSTFQYRFEARRLRREVKELKKVMESVAPVPLPISMQKEIIVPHTPTPKRRWFEI